MRQRLQEFPGFPEAHDALPISLRLEAVSGSAKVEVLGPNKAVWYSWNFCCSLSEQIDCRGIRNCTVRISAEDFCGKFDILLQ